MQHKWQGLTLACVAVIVCAQLIIVLTPTVSHAIPLLVRKTSAATTASATASVTATAATATDLLVVICAITGSVTISTPTGFTSAISETGTVSQAIFYKISVGGETTFTCTASVATYNVSAQVYEYSNVNTTTPFDAKNTVASTGSSTAYNSGSVTTTSAGDILIASFITDVSSTLGAWSNSFVQELTGTNSGGKASTKYTYASADYTTSATGTFSTAATGSTASNWRGQIVAFKPKVAPVLSTDVVDASGVSVASPSVSFGASTTSFNCQAVTGTLGSSAQKIRVNNTTGNHAWTVSIAATSGNTSTWTSGANTYSYNNSTSSGCAAGQLNIAPATSTITPTSGCSSTGVSAGAGASFTKGVIDSITLASATTSAAVNCSWDLTLIPMTQQIPAEQKSGTYSLGLTITVVAN